MRAVPCGRPPLPFAGALRIVERPERGRKRAVVVPATAVRSGRARPGGRRALSRGLSLCRAWILFY